MTGDYATAMYIAKKQVDDGAHVIDINVDDGLLYVVAAVTDPGTFLAWRLEVWDRHGRVVQRTS